MALPSENRLKSEILISLVYKKGASWKTPFFRCIFLPSKFKKFQSLVSVSKKYDKRATERNAVRRRINGVLQQKLFQYKEKGQKFPENLYIILPYDSAKNATHAQLEEVIEKMIRGTQDWKFSQKPRKFSRKK